MNGGRRLALAMAGAAIAAACSPTATDRVDGWATGAFLLQCTDRMQDADCAAIAGPAVDTIADERAVHAIKVYEEGPYIDAAGSVTLANRGGGPVRIVVVTYEDGSRRAAGVYCGLVVEVQPSTSCAVVDAPFD